MTIYQILAWPGTAPSIILTTVTLHYVMFSRKPHRFSSGALVAMALFAPSLVALSVEALMPDRLYPKENLMPGLGEAMLLAICIPMTALSAIIWLIRRKTSRFP